jgi:hypothetical protein
MLASTFSRAGVLPRQKGGPAKAGRHLTVAKGRRQQTGGMAPST